MEGKSSNKQNLAIGLLFAIYFFGALGHIIGPTRGLFQAVTPPTLFFIGIIVLLFTSKGFADLKFWVWVIVTFAITFIIEAIGVQTGLIFGSYTYGTTLGLSLLNTPLIIGFNWVVVILGCVALVQLLIRIPIVTAMIAGVFAVIFDVILEPAAIKLGYWSWANVSVPLQNYIAWLVIAFAFSYIFSKLKIKINSKLVILNLFMQALFMLVIGVLV
jgi:putative membrane protein